MDNEFIDKIQLEQKEEAEAKKEEKKPFDKLKGQKKEKTVKPVKEKKPGAFVQILNGDFLTKEFMMNNLNFIFFLILLLLLILGKSYYGKELSTNVMKTQKELDEITSDYFEAKAKLEEDTRRLELVRELEPIGLKETVNPTKVIRIKKEKTREQ